MITDRENWLRAIEYRYPEWIPSSVGFLPMIWLTHREKLEEVVLRHPLMFPGYKPGSAHWENLSDYYTAGKTTTDNWACTWRVELNGAEGQVVGHPLADWDAFKTFQPPDPRTRDERGDRDWDKIKQDLADAKSKGNLAMGYGGRLFDRLYSLRGFENLMIDIATDDPRLTQLVQMLTDHAVQVVDLYLEAGADAIAFHTDIGTQRALMISPEKFRKHIKPMFKTIFQRVRNAGIPVHLSSDGHLLEIVDDLIECGVSMHDPQLRANTLEGIERAYKGKMCINLDLDRQMFAFCTPQDIHDQIREAVERLDLPEGGLMMVASVCDGETSLENIEAMCTAMEKYCLKGKKD